MNKTVNEIANDNGSGKPPEQRPEHPDFWCKRFGEGITPWDAGKVPDDFAAFVASQPAPLNTLIPGCGSAWEAVHLNDAGWPVTALDFSPAAVAKAREVLGDAVARDSETERGVNLVCADFFTYTPRRPLDLIYERAFLCALPRKLWDDWGKHVARLLPSGGLLAGYFFLCEQPKGPPFGILPDQLAALLGESFVRLEDVAVNDSIPVFSGRERWQVWQRR